MYQNTYGGKIMEKIFIGIVIGWVLCNFVAWLKEAIAMGTHAKAMKENGKNIKTDFVNLRIVDVDNMNKSEKGKSL